MEPEPAFPRRCRQFPVRVSSQQGGVDVDHIEPGISARHPRSRPCVSRRGLDPLQHVVVDRGEGAPPSGATPPHRTEPADPATPRDPRSSRRHRWSWRANDDEYASPWTCLLVGGSCSRQTRGSRTRRMFPRTRHPQAQATTEQGGLTPPKPGSISESAERRCVAAMSAIASQLRSTWKGSPRSPQSILVLGRRIGDRRDRRRSHERLRSRSLSRGVLVQTKLVMGAGTAVGVQPR